MRIVYRVCYTLRHPRRNVDLDPVSMAYLGILGGGFAFGVLRLMFMRRTRKIIDSLYESEYHQQVDLPSEPPPVIEDLDSSESPIIDWHVLSLPDSTNELTEPPEEEPPVGEDAEIGEEARDELYMLREDWIEENELEFDTAIETVDVASEVADEIEVVTSEEVQEDEFNLRIEREGAQSGQVHVTLLWNNHNDLDLHVFCPSGERIYFNNKTSKCGGELDVDMNVKPTSRKPIENVYWSELPPAGEYRVCIHHYARHRKWRTKDPTDFSVRVRIASEVNEYKGSITKGDPMMVVCTFTIS